MIYGPGETPISDSKKVTITRDEEHVFAPETIASFEGKAITIRHPEVFVGPDNWSELAKGVMQNVRRGDGDNKDDLLADLLITDKMAIGLVKNGLREVSCGYEADYEQTGEDKGKQKNIVGNHLALVDQGRAGSGYAINDHKGEESMKFTDRVKAIFAKAQDEAMKIAEDEDKKVAAKDEDKKDDKTKDASALDEVKKMVADLGEKIAAMAPKAKDEDKKDDKKKDEPAKDEDKKEDDKKASDEDDKKEDADKAKDEPAGMEDRLKALEAAVEKLLEKKAGDEDKSEDEDDTEEYSDEDESKDDDFDNSTMIGDSAEVLSRAEILAPGIAKSKDIVVKALKTCFESKDGKEVIKSLTGGKAPTFDSAERVQTLFIAASEVLKASRTKQLSETKKTKITTDSVDEVPRTPEQVNAFNAKFYKNA